MSSIGTVLRFLITFQFGEHVSKKVIFLLSLGKPFCKRCYAANFKPQGFGFGSLGGYTGVGAGGKKRQRKKEREKIVTGKKK
jgi:hypothetical protein